MSLNILESNHTKAVVVKAGTTEVVLGLTKKEEEDMKVTPAKREMKQKPSG